MSQNLLELLQPYFDDDSVNKILINGHDKVFVQNADGLSKIDMGIESEQALREMIDRLLSEQGVEGSIADFRLANGALMNVILPPVATTGIAVTIHKHGMRQLSWQDLVEFGSMNEQMSEFLQACVSKKLNICVAGGANSGKSTLFNELAASIPEDERVIVVESGSDLDLRRENVVMLDANNASDVSMTDLVVNALKMAPDRLVFGAVQGSVIVDILQAMDIGMDGIMFHVNATSIENAFTRMLIMAQMHPLYLAPELLSQQIADGLDIIVMQEYLPTGKRRITRIAEVVGYEDDIIMTETIFKYAGEQFHFAGYSPELAQKLQ